MVKITCGVSTHIRERIALIDNFDLRLVESCLLFLIFFLNFNIILLFSDFCFKF